MIFPRFKRPNPNGSPPPLDPNPQGLGTFGGVYTPSILTILGVIMYLRLGWVVGNVGVLGTLAIVTLSTSITLITSLSVCAIATDRVVRTGGAYYMISRSLGLETGGAVGLSLYFAQTLSVALYTIGFAESVVQAFGSLNQTYVALVTTIGVAVLALTSAELAIRAQYFIMAAIALSLLALLFGPTLPDGPALALQLPSTDISFWIVFAVFFPAVTGIMAGVSMSGDLKNPSRSIPLGTLGAVATGYVIYMALPLILGFRADGESLLNDPLVMERLSLWKPAFLLGVWGATLSSALGSILAAPRVLQALARDRVLPSWLTFLEKGSAKTDEPRLGTIVTLGVVIAAVCLGDLNVIAPVLTMFFLTTYLMLNLAAGIEGFLATPSFRPSFQVHWLWSMVGALGCFSVMLLINPLATFCSATIVSGIYFWLRSRELKTTWGDVRRGLWMALLHLGIFQIDPQDDPRNWRPHILVLSGAPNKRWLLVELANLLTHNRGFVTVASVVPQGSRDWAQQANLEQLIQDSLRKQDIQALVKVVPAADPFDGALKLVETYGFGPLVPNTLLLGASGDPSRLDRYCTMISELHQAKRNVLILRDTPTQPWGQRCGRIDLWWGGLQANGSLMLVLANLLRSTLPWRNAQIYLKLVVNSDTAATLAHQNLNPILQALRVKVIPTILIDPQADRPEAFSQILQRSSQGADLIFLGMARPSTMGSFTHYYTDLQERTAHLPPTLYVLAAPDFAFEEVLRGEPQFETTI